MRPVLTLALTTAALLAIGFSPQPLLAKDPKPVKNAKIEAAIAKLYDGAIELTDNAKREPLFLEIDKQLAKDKKDLAIKSPGFWVRAVQGSYFSNSKVRPSGKKGKVVESKMTVYYKNGKSGEVPIWFRAGNSYSSKTPALLMVSILPEGTDPAAYIKTWEANDHAKKNWIVAAVAESKEYPISKEPLLAVYPFVHMRDVFNTDSNRWYLEGVGATAKSVQAASISVFPDRLAGIVLREPTEAVTHANTSLFSAFVVHQGPPAPPAEGEAAPPPVDEAKLKAQRDAAEKVAEAYAALQADRHAADLDATDAVASIVKWVSEHPGRALRHKYTYQTTMGEGTGEPFTGSLMIVSPAKYGEPTNLTVEYDTAAGAVSIAGENLGEFIIYMNDDLLDLDQPVSIVVNGTEVVSKKFERNFRDMFELADAHGEYGRMFPAAHRAFAPSETSSDPGDGPGGDKSDGDKKDGDGE